MVYCSLKENTYYDSEMNVFDYKLVDDNNNVIYFGHSVKNPKTGINRINITEIVRDYLSSELEDNWDILSNETGYVCQQEDSIRLFTLINGELILESYLMLLCYEDIFTGDDRILSEPVTSKIDPRMKIFWTRFGEFSANISIELGYRDIKFSYTGEKNFDFSAQTRSYYYQSLNNSAITFGTDDDWFTITKTSNEVFTISVDTNIETSDRVGRFYISYINEDFKPTRKYFEFVQYSEHLLIDYRGSTYFDYTGGTTQISFSANTMIEFASGSYWLGVSNIEQEVLTIPYGDFNVVGTITINCEANLGTEDRTGEMLFRRKDFQYGEVSTLTFTQNHYYYFVLLSPSAYTVDYEQHTIILSAETDAETVSIVSDDYWASATFDNGIITLSISENTGENVRTGTLSIYVNSHILPVCFIRVTQKFSYANAHLTMEIIEDGYITLNQFRKQPTDYGSYEGWSVYFSVNGGEWIILSPGSGYINVKSGDLVRLRSYGPADRYLQEYYTTLSGTTATFNLYGNILSMDYAGDFKNYNSISEDYEFYGLLGHTNVVDAKNVIFPASTTRHCYKSMFYQCERLITAPSILPASSIAEGAYELMFYKCTSLETAPYIYISSISPTGCLSMFEYCTNLKEAEGVLSDSNIESYRYMFTGCSNLITAPELRFSTFAAYSCHYMFGNCNKLSYIKCIAENHSAEDCTLDWLINVSPTGTFAKKRGVYWDRNSSGIPEGWTVQEVD